MPRPREFDPNDILHKAMTVFWEKGYLDTSIEDLVHATGVSRYGLYDEFVSKHGFFLACLDHYQHTIVQMAFGPVERPGASVNEIRTYFGRLLDLLPTGRGRLGCLMANTASEVAYHDREAAGQVKNFSNRLRAGFGAALSNAKSNGELADGYDTEQSADFLFGIVLGLSVMARSQADPRAIANVVTKSLSCLG